MKGGLEFSLPVGHWVLGILLQDFDYQRRLKCSWNQPGCWPQTSGGWQAQGCCWLGMPGFGVHDTPPEFRAHKQEMLCRDRREKPRPHNQGKASRQRREK